MGENFLNLAKDLTLQIQEAEQTPSRLKTKKKTLKAARDKSCIIYGEDQFKLGHISHLNHGDQKEVTQDFTSIERKEVSIMNSMSGKNIFQK